jgi:O-antigen/teichoic acid export membrane protein
LQQKHSDAVKGGKYGRLLKNTLILTLGTFGSKLLVFLLLPLYTNCLLPSEYSSADLIANLANFLIPVFCCGVSEGVLRFSLKEKSKNGEAGNDRKAVFSASLCITLLGSLIAFLFFPLIQKIRGFESYGLLVVLYVISSNLHSIAAEYVRACERHALYSFQGVLNTVFVITLNLIFLPWLDLGVYGYVLSIILADALTTVFLVFRARLYRDFSVRTIRKSLLKDLLRFSLPLIPGTILWWIISVSDRYLLTWMSGGTVNGLYVVAAKVPTLLTLLCTVFLSAWKVSAVTEDSGDSAAEKQRKSEFYARVYQIYITVLFCAGAGIILFSKIFAKILFANEFYSAWQYIPVLTMGALLYNLSRFLGSIYFVNKRSGRSSLTAALAAVLNVALNLHLIPRYGAFGAAIATLVAYLAEYIVREVDTKREIRFTSYRIRILAYLLILSLEAIVVTLEIPYWIWISVGLTLATVLISGKTLLVLLRSFMQGVKGVHKKFTNKQ